jgi:hypothetical protein
MENRENLIDFVQKGDAFFLITVFPTLGNLFDDYNDDTDYRPISKAPPSNRDERSLGIFKS